MNSIKLKLLLKFYLKNKIFKQFQKKKKNRLICIQEAQKIDLNSQKLSENSCLFIIKKTNSALIKRLKTKFNNKFIILEPYNNSNNNNKN